MLVRLGFCVRVKPYSRSKVESVFFFDEIGGIYSRSAFCPFCGTLDIDIR